MTNINKRAHSPEFKTQVVMEVLKEEKTLADISSKFAIHPTQIRRWKEQAVAGLTGVFTDKSSKVLADKDKLVDELYRQIGQLKVELDWLKKKMGLTC